MFEGSESFQVALPVFKGEQRRLLRGSRPKAVEGEI